MLPVEAKSLTSWLSGDKDPYAAEWSSHKSKRKSHHWGGMVYKNPNGSNGEDCGGKRM